MRKKLNRKLMIFTALFYGFLIGTVVFLYLTKDNLKDYRYYIIAFTFLFAFIGNSALSKYENTADKKYIEKMVSKGKIVLVKANDSLKGNIIKSPLRASNIYYMMNVTVYEQNGNKHDAQLIDLFSIMQEDIPKGYFYVTYDGNDDDMLVVPMGLISMHEINQNIVANYEKNVKGLEYLNVYFNKGMVIETYETTSKRLEEEKSKQKT